MYSLGGGGKYGLYSGSVKMFHLGWGEWGLSALKGLSSEIDLAGNGISQ
jgi:hypothetical protein